jgi:hypothetical protein
MGMKEMTLQKCLDCLLKESSLVLEKISFEPPLLHFVSDFSLNPSRAQDPLIKVQSVIQLKICNLLRPLLSRRNASHHTYYYSVILLDFI